MSMDARACVCGLAHAAETFASRFSRHSLEELVGMNVDAKFQGLEGTTGGWLGRGKVPPWTCHHGRLCDLRKKPNC